MIKVSNFIKFLLIFIILTAKSPNAYAVFTLSVSPHQGGQDLRFQQSEPGQDIPNEEVTFTVTSTDAVQYRIMQTFTEPLTNEKGQTIPQSAFVAFSPSSPLGTLRILSNASAIAIGQDLIYTSNSAGDSDTFVIVFALQIPDDQPGGHYRGRLVYLAEPTTAGATSPSAVTMNIQVDVRPQFRLSVTGRSGPNQINLGSVAKDSPVVTDEVAVNIQSNAGGTYRLYQELTEPLMSAEGNRLPSEVFKFVEAGGKRGSLGAVGTPAAVSDGPTVIYTSDDTGSSDQFTIVYSASPDASQKAGFYRGNLVMRVESAAAAIPVGPLSLPVSVEIESILDVNIELGEGDMNFGVFGTGHEKEERSVIITVQTNRGVPYQVSQILARDLTNEKGQTVSRDRFVFYGQGGSKGTVLVPSSVPVEPGETAVYRSDSTGSPDRFTLNYSLSVSHDVPTGNYSTDLRYSIVTI